MNSKKTILSTGVIVIALFNLLVFLLPIDRNNNFWVVYVSSMTSIILACVVFLCTLTKKSMEAKFNNLALDWVVWGYFIVQSIASVIELACNTDYRTSLLINVVILGITAILLVLVSTGKKEIERVDNKVNEKVFFIKELQVEIDTMIEKTNSNNLKKMLQDLSEVIRYSDPMTNSNLADIENKIEINVKQLNEAMDNGSDDEEQLKTKITEIQSQISERNRKAKLYKGKPEVGETSENTVNNKTVSIAGVTIIVLIIIGITLYVTTIQPNTEYNQAMRLLQNKQYFEAQQAFKKMAGYKDSEDMSKEAIYLYASELKNNGQYIDAVEQFRTIEEYKDSKDLIQESIYTYANELFEVGQYEEAIEQFNEIQSYKDSEDKIDEVIYEYATELLDNKEYSKAAEQFLKLDNYKDSKDKVIEIYNLFGENDVVYFGKYNEEPIEWQILETREDEVLLITKEPIDEMAYNTEYESAEWTNSAIRNWINGEFYNSFDSSEKSRIVKNSELNDNVFLLSKEGVESYDELKNASQSWWIRTQGEDSTKAMYVTENGSINEDGDIVTRLHGVRPCLWLSLD